MQIAQKHFAKFATRGSQALHLNLFNLEVFVSRSKYALIRVTSPSLRTSLKQQAISEGQHCGENNGQS